MRQECPSGAVGMRTDASAGMICAMIVRLAAEGVVVQDADDLGRLQLHTDLDADSARTALLSTESGELIDTDSAWLDVVVLRSRAALLATAPDWAQRWEAMIDDAERKGRLSQDGRAMRVPIER
jgi:hypothetical protein